MSTITREFTKEQLIAKAREQIAFCRNTKITGEGHTHVNQCSALFEIALASLEAEPVGEVVLGEYDDCGCHPDARVVCIAADGQADWENFKDGTRLYTAPSAPVSMPETLPCPVLLEPGLRFGKGVKTKTMLEALQRHAEYCADLESMTQEQRKEHDAGLASFKAMLASVAPKKATWADAPVNCENVDWAQGWNACRATMLQGAERVSNRDKLPEGWVACSERMPEEIGRYWCYVEEHNDLGKSQYQWNCSWNGDKWWVEHEDGGRVTHWMPLPAAPQQEVKVKPKK